MDVGAAWTALTNNGAGLGVRTGCGRHCELLPDRRVECDTLDGGTATLNHSEFLSEFSGSFFSVVQTQDLGL